MSTYYTVYPKKYAHGFCFVVVIHRLIFTYISGLLHWHCGNLTIAPVPAKQPWWIWINTSCEFIMNDCITTTKQSTTKPCAYFLGYTVIQDQRKRHYRFGSAAKTTAACRAVKLPWIFPAAHWLASELLEVHVYRITWQVCICIRCDTIIYKSKSKSEWEREIKRERERERETLLNGPLNGTSKTMKFLSKMRYGPPAATPRDGPSQKDRQLKGPAT